jgi:hypothetical protein
MIKNQTCGCLCAKVMENVALAYSFLLRQKYRFYLLWHTISFIVLIYDNDVGNCCDCSSSSLY